MNLEDLESKSRSLILILVNRLRRVSAVLLILRSHILVISYSLLKTLKTQEEVHSSPWVSLSQSQTSYCYYPPLCPSKEDRVTIVRFSVYFHQTFWLQPLKFFRGGVPEFSTLSLRESRPHFGRETFRGFIV